MITNLADLGLGNFTAIDTNSMRNPYAPFFGELDSSVLKKTDPYQNQSSTIRNLAEYYKGSNLTLKSYIDMQIFSTSQFLSKVILPIKETDEQHFEWNVWMFNHHLMEAVPYQGVSRYITSKMSSNSKSTIRYGLAFTLEDGFMKTKMGQANYFYNLKTIAASVIETHNFDIVTALLSANIDAQLWTKRHGFFSNKSFAQIAEIEKNRWATLQKDKHGFEKMDAMATESIRHARGNADTWLLTPAMKIYLSLVPEEKTDYNIAGSRGPERVVNSNSDSTYDSPNPIGVFGSPSNKVYIVRQFNHDHHQSLDLMVRYRQIGEYYTMMPRRLDVVGYTKKERDIAIYDEDKDDWSLLTIETALHNCVQFEETRNALDSKYSSHGSGGTISKVAPLPSGIYDSANGENDAKRHFLYMKKSDNGVDQTRIPVDVWGHVSSKHLSVETILSVAKSVIKSQHATWQTELETLRRYQQFRTSGDPSQINVDWEKVMTQITAGLGAAKKRFIPPDSRHQPFNTYRYAEYAPHVDLNSLFHNISSIAMSNYSFKPEFANVLPTIKNIIDKLGVLFPGCPLLDPRFTPGYIPDQSAEAVFMEYVMGMGSIPIWIRGNPTHGHADLLQGNDLVLTGEEDSVRKMFAPVFEYLSKVENENKNLESYTQATRESLVNLIGINLVYKDPDDHDEGLRWAQPNEVILYQKNLKNIVNDLVMAQKYNFPPTMVTELANLAKRLSEQFPFFDNSILLQNDSTQVISNANQIIQHRRNLASLFQNLSFDVAPKNQKFTLDRIDRVIKTCRDYQPLTMTAPIAAEIVKYKALHDVVVEDLEADDDRKKTLAALIKAYTGALDKFKITTQKSSFHEKVSQKVLELVHKNFVDSQYISILQKSLESEIASAKNRDKGAKAPTERLGARYAEIPAFEKVGHAAEDAITDDWQLTNLSMSPEQFKNFYTSYYQKNHENSKKGDRKLDTFTVSSFTNPERTASPTEMQDMYNAIIEMDSDRSLMANYRSFCWPTRHRQKGHGLDAFFSNVVGIEYQGNMDIEEGGGARKRKRNENDGSDMVLGRKNKKARGGIDHLSSRSSSSSSSSASSSVFTSSYSSSSRGVTFSLPAFNKRFRKNLRKLEATYGDCVSKWLAYVFLMTQVSKEGLKTLYDADCVVPVSFLVFRPHMNYRMAMGIKVLAGSQTGNLMVGHRDFQLGNNPKTKVFFGHYTLESVPVVHAPQNVYVAYDIFAQGCEGGCGVKIWNENNIKDYLPMEGEWFKGDLFFIMVPYEEGKNGTLPNPLDASGHFSYFENTGLLEHQEESRSHYSTASYYNNYWKWRTALTSRVPLVPFYHPYHESPLMREFHYNTLMWHGHEFYWNRVDQRMSLMHVGTGHWGPEGVGPTAKAVRNGELHAFKDLEFIKDSISF
jgi:hypothetical protein